MNDYQLQNGSVWRFPDRGSWATHKGDYRGNWSPHIPKNLLLKYTNEGDTVLDQFLGSGTTLIECKLLNRNAIGIDINFNALELSKKRTNFITKHAPEIKLLHCDARKLSVIQNSCIDFICTHPPYADIIKYSDSIENDLSLLSVENFLIELKHVANESHRVLRNDKFCAFMIGDIRKKGNIIPLGFRSMQIFHDAGFVLKEIIIKEQFNCRQTKYWKSKINSLNFYLLMHEYIFVFKKCNTITP